MIPASGHLAVCDGRVVRSLDATPAAMSAMAVRR